MSSTSILAPPVVAGARAALVELAQIADAALAGCGQEDLLAALDSAHELAARTAGLAAALLGELDQRGVTIGSVTISAGALLRDRYCTDATAARLAVRHAYAASRVFPIVLAGQRDGLVSDAQARAIVAGLDRLPHTSTDQERDEAQQTMVGYAAQLDPARLRTVAHRLVETLTCVSEDVEPPEDGPDEHDRRSFVTHRRDGGVGGAFFFPGMEGEQIAAFLAATAQPDNARYGDHTGHDNRSLAQRQADAISEATSHVAGCDRAVGPAVPQVIVTMDLTWLTRQTSARPTLLASGRPMGATEARMAACADAVIPFVLGTNGEVLDAGRAVRLYTQAMRRAIAVRDGGCIFPGCDQPVAACHGHHLVRSWADGGGTSAATGALLCGAHHRQVHRQGWTGRLDGHGLPLLIPPAWIDVTRAPRQHHRFTIRRPPDAPRRT